MTQPTIILFGPGFRTTVAELRKDLRRTGASARIVGVDRAEEIALPEGDSRYMLGFRHYVPGKRGQPSSRDEFREWSATLFSSVREVVLAPPKPNLEWFFGLDDSSVKLSISWIEQPVRSTHVIEVAKTLESAVVEHGGDLTPATSWGMRVLGLGLASGGAVFALLMVIPRAA